MKIYLVQHGEASAKEVDPERALTEKGKADVERISQFLQDSGVSVRRVIHSGKLRAAQTAEIMANRLAPDSTLEVSDLINPNDNPADFDWQSGDESRDVLIVGHLPFMAKLVSHLLTDNAEQALVAYQPGSIVCLEYIESNRWLLNWMLRPELV